MFINNLCYFFFDLQRKWLLCHNESPSQYICHNKNPRFIVSAAALCLYIIFKICRFWIPLTREAVENKTIHQRREKLEGCSEMHTGSDVPSENEGAI